MQERHYFQVVEALDEDKLLVDLTIDQMVIHSADGAEKSDKRALS